MAFLAQVLKIKKCLLVSGIRFYPLSLGPPDTIGCLDNDNVSMATVAAGIGLTNKGTTVL